MEQPWLRFTVTDLVASTDPFSRSEINLLIAVFQSAPYWLPGVLTDMYVNALILKLAKALDVFPSEAVLLFDEMEKVGYNVQGQKRTCANTNTQAHSLPWIYIEGVLLIMANIYQ
eukprot:Phypoly_transcript_22518.p1 GENE.Phypoly_transcript_22518~~Phypoly_transcript_22518.p1  ORF type:complete len:115 (+),score=5.20 Phypoly_transcript_22518:252-596(+)